MEKRKKISDEENGIFLGQTFKKVGKKRGHSRVYPEPVMFPTFPIRCMDQHDADLQVFHYESPA